MRFTLLPLIPLIFTLLHAQEKDQADTSAENENSETATKQDSVTIAGQKIDYRVTAAMLTLKTDKDDDRADIFHVSYERIGIKDRTPTTPHRAGKRTFYSRCS